MITREFSNSLDILVNSQTASLLDNDNHNIIIIIIIIINNY